MISRLLRCPQAAQLEFRQRTRHNASRFHRRAFSGEKGAGHPGVLVLAAATQACSELSPVICPNQCSSSSGQANSIRHESEASLERQLRKGKCVFKTMRSILSSSPGSSPSHSDVSPQNLRVWAAPCPACVCHPRAMPCAQPCHEALSPGMFSGVLPGRG